MASNHTSNYQLNQWASQDQVLRAEFNQDNARIDAALGKKAEKNEVQTLKNRVEEVAGENCLFLLKTYTVPSNVQSVDFTIPNPEKYTAMVLKLTTKLVNYYDRLQMQYNNISTLDYTRIDYSYGGSSRNMNSVELLCTCEGVHTSFLTFYSINGDNGPLCCVIKDFLPNLSYMSETSFICKKLSFSSLQKLHFFVQLISNDGNGYVSSGTKLRLYGIK